MKAIQLVNTRVIVQTVLLTICGFYFLYAFQTDNNSNRICVLEHKYVLGPSQSSLSLSPNLNESESGPKYIYVYEH